AHPARAHDPRLRAGSPARRLAAGTLSRLDGLRRLFECRLLLVEPGHGIEDVRMEQIASRFVLLAALAAGVLVVPTAGEAQLIAGPGLGSKAKNAGPPPAPPPPALPGARVSKEMVAPPDRPPSDLQPNDALFD